MVNQQKSPFHSESIAVIGLGCWYPGSQNVKTFWENIVSGRQQFRNLPDCRLPFQEYYDADKGMPDKTYGRKAALINGYEFDWRNKKIPKSVYESTDIVHWLALDVALEAIKDAGLDLATMENERTGVIVGNTLTGEFTRSNFMRLRWPYVEKVLQASLQEKGVSKEQQAKIRTEMEELYKSVFAPVTEDTLAGGLSNTIAGRIANYCDFHGGGYVVDGACASSLLAVTTAADHLLLGNMDTVITGGVDISLDTFELVGFAKAGALTADRMKVYDAQRSGFIPGEGCGFVVLKRLSDAERDGNTIYATLNGWGISSDGKGGITAPKAEGQAQALIRAYQRAGYSPEKLNFIEGHGTGTKVGDEVELNAILKTFEHFEVDNNQTCGMTSLKSVMGHTKAAAGIGAFIKTVIALNQRVMPPTAGISTPHPIFNQENVPLFPLTSGQKLSDSAAMHAGVSAMGFGGINSHVTLSAPKSPPLKKLSPRLSYKQLFASSQTSEVFVLSAENKKSLLSKLAQLQGHTEHLSQAELADLAHLQNKQVNAQLPWKVSFVVSTSDELSDRIAQLVNKLFEDDHEDEDQPYFYAGKDYWFSCYRAAPKIGYLFPGQGSQQINMGKQLVNRFDWAQATIENFDQLLNEAYSFNISDKIFKPMERATEAQRSEWRYDLAATQIAQPSIVCHSLLWHDYLAKLGISPIAMGGHSLGELMAFHCAGAIDRLSLLKFSALRGQAMGSTKSKGKMLSLRCNAKQVQLLIDKVKNDYVTISNWNSPNQTIVSGTASGIASLTSYAQQAGISSCSLPVSNAFHSELVAEAAQHILQAKPLSETSYSFSDRPKLFSSFRGQQIHKVEQLNQHFSEQITSPVQFVEMLQAMQSSCDVLVEVGPGRVLSNLVSEILPNQGIISLPVEANPHNSDSLNYLLAHLFALGAELNWSMVYAGRLVREFNSFEQLDFIVNPLERPLKGKTEQIIEQIALVKEADFTEASLAPISTTSVPAPTIEKTPVAKSPQSPPPPPQPSFSVEALLARIAAKMTGFEADTIQSHHRLLDDLNLDSIKSAELVTEAVRTLNIDRFEVSSFANASIQEIAAALQAESPQQKIPDQVRKVQKKVQKSISDTWVRTFVVDQENTSLPPLLSQETLPLASHWAVLGETSAWTKEIQNALKTDIYLNLDEIKETDTTLAGKNLLLILPQTQFDPTDFDALARIHTLQQLTVLPFDSLKSLHVVYQKGEVDSLFASIHAEHPHLPIRMYQLSESLESQRLVQLLLTQQQPTHQFTRAEYTATECVHSYPKANYDLRPRNLTWTEQDVVLVTGGAKGITAACALEWAKHHHAQFVLLGRSSSGDKEVQETLSSYIRLGRPAYYYQCDASDKVELTSILKTIQQQMGSISCVIHGAGLNRPAPFHRSDTKAVYQEIAPKVLGLQNLLQQLPPQSLKMVAIFSSIIGYIGMPGNAWYAWSNACVENMLSHYRKQNPSIETCALGFSVWETIGMGHRLKSVEKLSEFGIDAIPTAEGVAAFVELMDNTAPNKQNYIVTARLGSNDVWRFKAGKQPQAHRFLEKIEQFTPAVELICQAHLHIEKDRYLEDHNFNGSLLFPTVFGLEAMSQAVAQVLNLENLPAPVEIHEIKLERPIVVNQENGAMVQIEAHVENTSNTEIRVNASIKPITASESHFSATFVIPTIAKERKKTLTCIPERSIDIDVATELYGDLLFQGPLFQQLEQVFTLDSQQTLLKLKTDGPALKKEFYLLGNPFVRDALLQTMQLPTCTHVLLPVHIQKLTIHAFEQAEDHFAECQVIERQPDEYSGTVVKFSASNQEIAEELSGYKVKVVASRKAPITPESLVDPTELDHETVHQACARIAKEHDLLLPDLSLFYFPHLAKQGKNKRHDLLTHFIQARFPEYGELSIEVLQSGKPSIKNNEQLKISISHDAQYCLSVLGKQEQGCDIETIQARDKETWLRMLGEDAASHLETLMEAGFSRDEAGTSLWSLQESLYKAFGERHLPTTIDSLDITEKFAIFIVEQGKFKVLTKVVSLIRRSSRVIAILAQSTRKPAQEIQVQRQFSYTHTFLPTFKDIQGIDKTANISIYANWMGRIRELPLQNIQQALLKDLLSGQWGMVTNESWINIEHPTTTLNPLETKLSVRRALNRPQATIEMFFEWWSQESGRSKRMASAFLSTTWVNIVSHGEVVVQPMPEYLSQLIDSLQVMHWPVDEFAPIFNDSGEKLYRSSHSPARPHYAYTKSFPTTLEHSNTVGNIYFSHYYTWQNEVWYDYLHALLPSYYQAFPNTYDGFFYSTHASVRHFREGMPFDVIKAKLVLLEIRSKKLNVNFDFFKQDALGNDIKISTGTQVLEWRNAQHQSIEIPEIVINALMASVISEEFTRENLGKEIVRDPIIETMLEEEEVLAI